MRLVMLFLVILMLFFLWLVPICFPFGLTRATNDSVATAIGFAYTFWYIAMFILTLILGDSIRKNGCWFFNK